MNGGMNKKWGIRFSVYSTGGIMGIDPKDCSQETPNTPNFEFLNMLTERCWSFEKPAVGSPMGKSGMDISIVNMFYGTDGYLENWSGDNWKAFSQKVNLNLLHSLTEKRKAAPAQNNYLNAAPGLERSIYAQNFLDGIRKWKCCATALRYRRKAIFSSALPLMS